jgi:hypothetical protein
MRLRFLAAFTGVCVVAFAAGALAYPYLVQWWKPDQKSEFVNACKRNGHKLEDCACTYNAYVRLRSPYSELVKSSVHNTPSDHWQLVASVVVRKLAEAGIGVDPKEVIAEMRVSNPELSVVRAGLVTLHKLLDRYKYKVLGRLSGFGTVALMWWSTAQVSWEAVSAKYTVDSHCGGMLVTAVNLPGRMWENTSGAAGWTWDVVKSAPSKVVWWRAPQNQ